MTAYTDFHYSPTGSGVISGAQVLEQTEQGINGLGQYVQDNISGAIDTANQALTIAQTADSNATLALNTANSFASAISAANNTANNALTTAQSAQNTANTASSLATTANNNANTALNAANTATANVGTLTNSVNALGNRMTTAENAISTNAGNITTLQTNLQTTNNNVTAAANAASAAQATATSAQSTATLARNQAYVLRYTGTTITGGGTIAYADIDNTDNIKAGDKIIDISGAIYAIASVDTANQTVTVGASPVINLFCDAENLIPAANETYDLGSSSYQWNNAYIKSLTINGIVCGDILTHNVSEFVKVTGNQTIGGVKTFTSSIGISKGSGDVELSIKNTSLSLKANTNSGMDDIRFIDKDNLIVGGLRQSFTNSKVTGTVYSRSYSSDGNSYTQVEFNLITDHQNGIGDAYVKCNNFYPNQNATINLGTSTNKWKTLNGINPGALSLPDMSLGTGVSLSAGSNSYSPPSSGWLSINLTGAISVVCGNFCHSGTDMLSVPVVKGSTYTVTVATSGTAYLFVSQGNV